MKIVILPGNHIINRKWVNSIDGPLKKRFEKVSVLHYAHWGEKEVLVNLEKEINNIPNDEVILAKSVGTILALKAVYEKKISPLKCIFIGTPIDWAEKNNMDPKKYLDNFVVPTLFIQNSKDPTCTSNDLKELLMKKNVKNYSLYEFEEESHDYENFDKIVTLIGEFVKK